MDYLLRNIEALGEEVAAALDELADEVTGRRRDQCTEGDEDEGPSDVASDRSVTSGDPPHWPGATPSADGAGSDTASSDGGAIAPLPAAMHHQRPPPEPERMMDGSPRTAPQAAKPLSRRRRSPPIESPASDPVELAGPSQQVSSGLRRRKAKLQATRVTTTVPSALDNLVAETPPVAPSQRDGGASPTRDGASPTAICPPPAATRDDLEVTAPTAPAHARVPQVSCPVPREPDPSAAPEPPISVADASQHQLRREATMAAARKKKQRPLPPAAASPPVPSTGHPVRNNDGCAVVPLGGPDSVSAPPPPPPARHARGESDSSAFDLCGGTPDGIASPTEEGEYLVL